MDRTSITEADFLTLTVSATDATAALALDFSAIKKDFDIINTQTRQSSSVSFINGRSTVVTSKDHILTLRPRRVGLLTIPAIIAGGERSAPISIRAEQLSNAARQQLDQLVFLQSDVDTKEPYVQGQIIYSVKLFYTEGVGGSFPVSPVLENAVVEVIENEKRYSSVEKGQAYWVIERRFAIFPQRSGKLTIPSEVFHGTFARGGPRHQRRQVSAKSKSHILTVKRVPDSFSGADWMPAKSFTITESWAEQPPKFRVGEPVNRQLSITASGVSDSLLPPLDDLPIPNARVYADPPTTQKQSGPDGVTATQTTTLGIVPVQAGELTLPEIRIPWWNTTTDTREFAILPAATYPILPASATDAVEPRVTVPISALSQPKVTRVPGNPIWQYIAIALGLLLLPTTWQWFSLRRALITLQSAQATKHAPPISNPDEADHYKTFKQACSRHEAAAAHRQLCLWVKARYPALQSLNELPAQDTDLAREIAGLEAGLFGPGDDAGTPWQGDRLAALIAEIRDTGQEQEERHALAGELNPG